MRLRLRSCTSARYRGRGRHLDDEVLGDRLLALGADVGDAAEDVQLGHVAGCVAGRDLEADGAVAVHGALRPVSRVARDVDQVELLEVALLHVAFVHEHDRAQPLEAAVAVVVRVDRGVELVVRPDRRQQEPALARVDVVRERCRRELGPPGRGGEDALPCRLRDPEAVRVASAAVEVLEALQHARHRVSDPVVVVDVVLPRRLAVRQGGLGYAAEDRALGALVRRARLLHPVGDVHHRHRVLDGHPLLAVRLAILVRAGEAGQDQRPLAVHDVAAVELRAHLDGELALAQRLEGVVLIRRAEGEVAAERNEDLHVACLHRLDRRDGAESPLARRVDAAHLAEAIQEGRVGMVVDAAGAVALHVAVAADRTRAGAQFPGSATPEPATISDHGVDATSAWYSSKPCVCWSMNSRSSPFGSFSAASSTALATPRSSARSPPIRTCTFIVPVLVVWKVAMSTNSCGTIVRREAASISGLMWTSWAPRRSASASHVSIRGALVAAFSPSSQIASACSQSVRSTVPLPLPTAAVSARPLASWHMFEQSGRLFVPNSRTQSWYRKVAS